MFFLNSQAFFFFASAKGTFLVSIWCQARVKVSEWLKSCLLAGGSGSGRDFGTGKAEGSRQGHQIPEMPSRAGRRASGRDTRPARPGNGQPAQGGSVDVHLDELLDELLLQEVVLQELGELGVCVRRTQDV